MPISAGGGADVAAADDGDHRYLAGAPGDDRGEFAVQCLVVHPAFAGDDEIAALQMGFEVQQVEEVVGAGHDAAAEEQPGEAETAGGAGSGVAANACGLRVSGQGQLVHQVEQTRIEGVTSLRGGALLWAVDGGGPVGSGERVLHVAGDDDLNPAEVGQVVVSIDRIRCRFHR